MKLLIQDRFKSNGEITVGGNKNAVLPMIAAALLTNEEIVLHNVPEIVDVEKMLAIARELGVKVRRDHADLSLKADHIASAKLPRALCSATRTSLLFAGPLAMRIGTAELWPPGGDVIGRRRLDAHFYGLRKLGINVDTEGDTYKFTKIKSSKTIDMFLDEASVTATEHIMTAAALTPGITTISNAAAEPHIEQLAGLLIKMGAKISGLGSNTLIIEGKSKLHGTEHTVEGDHIEAASFLSLAAATGGSVTINGILSPRYFWMTRRVFEKLGLEFKLEPNRITMPVQKMRITPDFGNAIPCISDGPWPQFPSDMMSCMIVAATQAKGTVLFFEKMFESRIYFVDRLIAMGANAVVCDPHRVVISGPANLRGTEMSSPDIRAGMALIIAGCCARGESIINKAEIVFRGYEHLPEKLTALGGKIQLISE